MSEHLTLEWVGPEALAPCLEIRRQVFVLGQGVPEEVDRDSLEEDAAHLLIRIRGRPVATARLRYREDAARAERVAVLEESRGRGLGRALMDALEREARRRKLRRMTLHAQVAVVRFYERLGYEAEGPVFEEAGIPHRAMSKAL
ncbi:MAG: GNAT family N-acetyltransferase [Myxococcota bacterium]